MSDVQSAYDRLRRLSEFGGDEEADDVYLNFDVWQPVVDAETLAQAYIDERAESQVTPTWLSSLGAVYSQFYLPHNNKLTVAPTGKQATILWSDGACEKIKLDGTQARVLSLLKGLGWEQP